jgi:hypothetical protein
MSSGVIECDGCRSPKGAFISNIYILLETANDLVPRGGNTGVPRNTRCWDTVKQKSTSPPVIHYPRRGEVVEKSTPILTLPLKVLLSIGVLIQKASLP